MFADEVRQEPKAGGKGATKDYRKRGEAAPPWRNWSPRGKGNVKGQARGKGKDKGKGKRPNKNRK